MEHLPIICDFLLWKAILLQWGFDSEMNSSSVCYSQRWLTSSHLSSTPKWEAWAPDTANKTSIEESRALSSFWSGIVLHWSGMGEGMSFGRTLFVSCFLWRVMILLCCYSSPTSHISIKRLDHGFSVFQVCSKVRKRYARGIAKSRSAMLYWRSLWLPIQCYIKILWRMFFVSTVSTKESWEGCEGWGAHKHSWVFQILYQLPGWRHGLNRDNSGLPPFFRCWGSSICLSSKIP